MDRARFVIAESIFNDLVGQPPERRAAHLSARCEGDGELRTLVEQLLANDRSGMGAFLREPAFLPPEDRFAGQESELPQQIGGYEILRRIGEGGMGVVYEARQANPRRTVALKVLRSALPSRETLSRFRHESQILAQLRHPGIAHVYEAAVSEVALAGGIKANQPYFAMELVEGRSLREFAAIRQLDARQRLELVALVCDAVQHAHEKGVIHRDLKSENILVEDSGQPRVLDFGVARLVGPNADGVTIQTHTGQIVGTLAYMSPEQLAGDPAGVDTRSDVYSLGVILFELLAGRMPYDVRDQPLAEAMRRVREDPAPSLSSFSRAFRGDIETIAAKAMHKDRARRYESAAALAGDIRRFLRSDPIEARRDSAAYMLGKTLQRYRWGVVAAGLIAASLVLAVAGTGYGLLEAREQSRQAEKARDAEAQQHALADERLAEAERQTRIARAVTRFLTRDLLAGDDPRRPLADRDERLSAVVARAEKQVDAGALKDDPEVEAAVRNILGHLYVQLGRIADAERHNRLVLELNQAAFGSDDVDTLLSIMNLAELFHTAGRLNESAEAYRMAFEIAERTHMDHEDVLATMYSNYAELLRSQHRFDEAEPLYLKALAQLDALPEPSVNLASLRGMVLSNMGELYREKGDTDRAVEFADRATEVLRAALGDEHQSIATTLCNKGLALKLAKDFVGAEMVYREALAMRQKVLPPAHPDLALSMNNLASLMRDRGDYAEAEILYRQTIDMARQALPPGHFLLALYRRNLGNCLIRLTRFCEAETEIQAAYDQLASTPGLPPDHVRVTIEAFVKLYDAWAAAEPDSPAAQMARLWRAKLTPPPAP